MITVRRKVLGRRQVGVSRQTLHVAGPVSGWWAGWAVDRSHRPASCPHRADAAVETAVCELQRHHPRWGPRWIRHKLGVNGSPGPVPSRMTVHRILVRHGLIDPTVRKRRRQDYRRWQPDAPMQLWQLDIVGGLMLAEGADPPVECKVVADHNAFVRTKNGSALLGGDVGDAGEQISFSVVTTFGAIIVTVPPPGSSIGSLSPSASCGAGPLGF